MKSDLPFNLPDPNAISQKLQRPRPWLYVLFACFCLLTLYGTRLINDSDLGFHLKSGQWILENHWVPENNTFTFTVPDHTYLDIEWLYQVQLYLVYLLGSYKLISLLHIGFILAAFLILFKRLKMTGASFGICVALLVIAVMASETRCRVRPEVLSWVLLGMTLWVLDERMSGGKDRLFWLPLIQWVWVNTEGLFPLGPGLMAVFWGSSLVHNKKNDQKLLKYLGWSMAACLANPYFIRGFLFPLTLLEKMRFTSSNIFKYTVSEFNPPWSLSYPGQWFPPLIL